MAYSYSVPYSDETEFSFMDLPTLAMDDLDTAKKVEWWNKHLAETDPELKVSAGANYQVKLNAKTGSWF